MDKQKFIEELDNMKDEVDKIIIDPGYSPRVYDIVRSSWIAAIEHVRRYIKQLEEPRYLAEYKIVAQLIDDLDSFGKLKEGFYEINVFASTYKDAIQKATEFLPEISSTEYYKFTIGLISEVAE